MIRIKNNRQRRKNDEEVDATTSSSLLFRQLTQAGGARYNGDVNE
jgi:hypothetical protein